jgi:hypothetical protein
MRSAREDPQPGDELVGQPNNGYGRRVRRTVLARPETVGEPAAVRYKTRGSTYLVSLEDWQRWAAGAEVKLYGDVRG